MPHLLVLWKSHVADERLDLSKENEANFIMLKRSVSNSFVRKIEREIATFKAYIHQVTTQHQLF